ncbi:MULTISPECIES: HlyD family secretion protein [Legionella]|uniref:Hemolysin D n=2 Tax=Legionella TaxID=445 RepID=A0A0W0TUF7_9GAMM|nr:MULTISPECIES: HlyD family secretion protein [Legionella]KTC99241.1 hemolysin D [Legionella feeleii]SPX62697.1 multidrug efflux system [Legionella feeleii]STX39069.1 multidrug efflux system [Legionella feeleii]STX41417.1 multidrug efflux system [Legionella donaldsonii]
MNRERLAAFPYWPHLITLTIIVLAFAGYRFFAYYYTRSDDAYVSANIINMASLVAGPISKIYVCENQPVKKGQKLIEIDPRPYKYAMDKAWAELQIAKLDYENERLAIKVAHDKLQQNQAMLALSRDHYQRYSKLQQRGDIPEIRLINVESKIQEQEAMVLSAAQELQIAQQNFDDNKVIAAKAVYEKARYLYEHTTVLAPTDGYVTNFNLRHGQYISVGQGLFAVVDTKRWWVVTRYRETVIRLIKPGDKAKIMLDMYPGKVFHGHVGSIGWGINRVQSGKVAPSTLVYLEATEYWIKIAQRFPVRIYIDDLTPEYPMRIGASATTITYR